MEGIQVRERERERDRQRKRERVREGGGGGVLINAYYSQSILHFAHNCMQLTM